VDRRLRRKEHLRSSLRFAYGVPAAHWLTVPTSRGRSWQRRTCEVRPQPLDGHPLDDNVEPASRAGEEESSSPAKASTFKPTVTLPGVVAGRSKEQRPVVAGNSQSAALISGAAGTRTMLSTCTTAWTAIVSVVTVTGVARVPAVHPAPGGPPEMLETCGSWLRLSATVARR
jgi:hypothetical protein